MPTPEHPMDKRYLLRYISDHTIPGEKPGCKFLYIRKYYRGHPRIDVKRLYPTIKIKGDRYLVTTLLLWIDGKIDKPILGSKLNLCHCHTCDDGRCINPDHIFISDARGNAVAEVNKGRHRFASKNKCKNGHSL